MAYTADKPRTAPDSSELRGRIPGWGVDLNPRDRPAVPKERFDPAATGAHWYFPERQVERYPREKSSEHKFLTPVFGTSCPPKGLSGVIRRYAYTLSEGRSSHWLLLVLADRVDVVESSVEALLRGHPDNPIAETGVVSEIKHGVKSRVGQGRADTKHLPFDVLLVAGPWLAAGGAAYGLYRVLKSKIAK
jgi:hypothetical protein